ncbi:MAG: SDR family NAD(P)-dependent oxidoreductase [Acidimicrobiales bacterium]|jgi:NAD(P)-dependent dehydrogenase (short-subunit alcohol dehydrogenase family)
MAATKRVAVVTGAARGLGRVVATTLAGEGYDLALVDLVDLDGVAGALAGPGSILVRVADVSVEQEVVALAHDVISHFGRVDALVNNAGISLLVPAEETSADAWRRVLEVNLTAPFFLCREFGRAMLAVGSGAIVNVASVAGLRGISHRVAYNASKHGLVGLTYTLAAEWGGRGVRVNAVCPGWIKTEMDLEDQGSGAYTDSDITGQVPMARFATPHDVAQAVAFLCDSSRSGYINGVALPVDGGWSSDGSWTSLRLKAREVPPR